MNLKILVKRLDDLHSKTERVYNQNCSFDNFRYQESYDRSFQLDFDKVRNEMIDICLKNRKKSKKQVNLFIKNSQKLLKIEKENEEFLKNLTIDKIFDKQIIEDFNIRTCLIDSVYDRSNFPFKFCLKEKNEDVLKKYTIHLKKISSLKDSFKNNFIIKYKNKDILYPSFSEYDINHDIYIMSYNSKFLFNLPNHLSKFLNFDKFKKLYDQNIINIISSYISDYDSNSILEYKNSFHSQSYLYDEIIDVCDKTLQLRVFK